MARTKQLIKDGMLLAVANHPVLGSLLTSTSATAIWILFIEIVAACVCSLEILHDLFKADVSETIAALKPHTTRWYAGIAKKFQYGYNLVADADYYDNTGISDSVVASSKIVTYAAVVEQFPGLRVKVAKTVGSDLAALSAPELAAFVNYMARVKDAGVRLTITSTGADNLLLTLRVKYNPLVLTSTGARIDGTVAEPVKDAVKRHLKNLPFNGVFSIQKLVDELQKVDGVADLSVDAVQVKYGALPFTSVNIDVIPDSGYLVILNTDLSITYIAA
jgi:hypothetical protein